MPAPQPEALSTSAKQYFSNLGIKLPMDWKSMGSQFIKAFRPPELSTPANSPDSLFHEPTLNKYHTQTAYVFTRDYEKYIDGICNAISKAIGIWMQNASIVNIKLAGTIGTVLPMAEFDGTGIAEGTVIEPGTSIGPDLKPLILNDAPQATIKEQQYSVAIASAISANWDVWANGLTGVLTYPPFGPPGPNIPTPLITFTSTGEANLAPERLTDQIYNHLMAITHNEVALHARALFESVAQSFFANFQVFKTNTMIAGVIMTPPVPQPPDLPEGELAEEEPVEEELEEDALAEGESEIEEPEVEEEEPEELEPEPEPEEEPEPITGGLVIPTPGNFI